ncbi:MAG: hypothetical protein KatS3mg075_164 [Meiothermus sp.]|nr:MAG: hypothetical protein KatS3mg075_164 [Meiothermus sp.]
MGKLLAFLLLGFGLALAQKDPHPCYLLGVFNPSGTPNALGSVGMVLHNNGVLQDGKPVPNAFDQSLALAVGGAQPMSYCIHTLASGGSAQLQYFKSSARGAKYWLEMIRNKAPSWTGLPVGDEGGLMRPDQGASRNLIFRYREYAFLLSNHPDDSPAFYRKWAQAIIQRIQRFK